MQERRRRRRDTLRQLLSVCDHSVAARRGPVCWGGALGLIYSKLNATSIKAKITELRELR